VLIYRQSGVLNFSLAPVATLGTYVTHSLIDLGTGYWLAAAAGIAAAAAASAAIELLVVRPLSRHDSMIVAIATFGPGLVIIGLLGYFYGNAYVPLPGPLTEGEHKIGPFDVGSNELLAIIVAIAALAGTLTLLRYTRFGLSLRAASEGPITAGMMGINVLRVQSVVWALSGALAAVAGLFLSADNYLDPTFLTTFALGSFAAIVLGGMESIAGLALGCVLFGLVSSAFAYFVTVELLQTLNFVSIVIILIAFPYGIFGRRLERVSEPDLAGAVSLFRRRVTVPHVPAVSPAVRRAVTLTGIALIVVAVAIYPLVGGNLDVFIVASVGASFVATAGLNYVSGYAGQGSLGQAGFLAIGAYVYAVLTVKVGIHPVLGLICATIAAGAVGVVFGRPAMRLSGVYLALITLAFTLSMPELAAYWQNATGGQIGLTVPSKGLFLAGVTPLDSQYWIIALFAAATALLSYRLGSGATGRRWRAVRDSEPGAASVGVNVARTKLMAFSLSGALGGLSGALSVYLIGYIAPDTYSVWLSAFLLAAIIIGGRGSTLGSLLGSAFVVSIPFVTSTTAVWSQVFFGASVCVVLLILPRGIARVTVLLKPRPHDISSQPPVSQLLAAASPNSAEGNSPCA
jgi:branched-chain amino acid transport system permease protein